MTHGSLFSGIGGFDLAAHWMGWDNIFHCEWNPFGQKVLKHHFPNSISYNDITKTDFSIHRGNIDILTGGFPCQPYSSAGERLGKADERHLFPEMLRAIKEIKPRWVIGENVRGLVSWGGGLVFHEVCSDLEREGYEVQPFLIPAAGVNAPHQRQRIWFVAFNSKSQRNTTFGKFCKGENSKPFGICRNNEQKNTFNANYKGRSTRLGEIQSENGEISKWDNDAEPSNSSNGDVTNTNGIGRLQNDRINNRESNEPYKDGETRNVADSQQLRLEHGEKRGNFGESKRETQGEGSSFTKQFEANCWARFPTVSPICGGDDGLPKKLDNITFSKWRKESIKGYGNAIVPQVAHKIFKTIDKFENSL